VAAGAIIGEGAVINIHLQPVGGHVTTVAGTCRYNVVGRFPRCCAAIMTTRAGAGGRGVIHAHAAPASCLVTGFAAVGGSDVAAVLPWCGRAIVAAGTVICEGTVIHIDL